MVTDLSHNQGTWSEAEYLALNTNRLVELSDGQLELLPPPTEYHQMILLFLCETVKQFVASRDLGKVLFAPLPVKLWEDKFRQPDIMFMLKERADRRGNKYWDGADLVMEVVSEDDPKRDLDAKRTEYAQAGIREYWIVDPRDQTVTVLTLDEGASKYRVAGKYGAGEEAVSILLDGLTVDVQEVFAQS